MLCLAFDGYVGGGQWQDFKRTVNGRGKTVSQIRNQKGLSLDLQEA